ncbi:MAG: sodium:solute symporter [Acidobacteria bacterium]|nr:MAG: sodium:solute symporter [Acidobacteriota bacterium]RPJ64668.1 MAG: sodium:solute symporter [Acidobacteriota bacterium]
MTPILILSVFLAYTALLFVVTWLTARGADNETFFRGNRSSPWYVIAYGMIGASLSGVTFMSVPGWVGTSQFTYMVMVLGYLAGYTVIATVLMPLYYKLNLTSIYTYLYERFGFWSYKTGASLFLISRVVGASFRMFLVVNVLQIFVFDAWGIPFFLTVSIFVLLILLYTVKGGIKTIIWTDTLQTTFMLLAVIVSAYLIGRELNVSFGDLLWRVLDGEHSRMWVFDWNDKRFFLKQFLGGAFVAIVMTGLDQEMMQKNLSCRSLRDAQKNMFSFSSVLIVVNGLFLTLGALLYLYTESNSLPLPQETDQLFPVVALKHLGPFAGMVFILGLISAAYPSADGALTSLTTSFTIDILALKKRKDLPEETLTRIRKGVHVGFALVLLVMILIFRLINDRAVIEKLFTVAGYTYGPLLGLYAFGLFTRRTIRDRLVPFVAVVSPVVCFFVSQYSVTWFGGYSFGFELLVLNGLLTTAGFFAISSQSHTFEEHTHERNELDSGCWNGKVTYHPD